MMRRVGWLIAIVFLIAGCGHSDILWTRSHNFPANTWTVGSYVSFEPDTVSIEKGTASVALLTIRYAEGANLKCFPIALDIESPSDGHYQCDTVRVNLLPRESRTGDNATFGIFETTDTLLLKESPRPGWRMTLNPVVAEETINGIFSITLTILNEK